MNRFEGCGAEDCCLTPKINKALASENPAIRKSGEIAVSLIGDAKCGGPKNIEVVTQQGPARAQRCGLPQEGQALNILNVVEYAFSPEGHEGRMIDDAYNDEHLVPAASEIE